MADWVGVALFGTFVFVAFMALAWVVRPLTESTSVGPDRAEHPASAERGNG